VLPVQRQQLAAPHAGEQGGQCWRRERVPIQASDETIDLIGGEDLHLLRDDFGRALFGGDIAPDQLMPDSITQSLGDDAVRVRDRTRTDSAAPILPSLRLQGAMPRLDVAGIEAL
jgi:hypothetical protein